MSTTNTTINNTNMQISIQHPTIPEIISRDIEETSKGENCNILKKPVRLSVFLKELEEAENEPIPDIQCSGNNDETDDELSEFDADVQDELELKNSELSLNSDIQEVEESKTPNINWLITPAKRSYFNSFLTPNVPIIHKPTFKNCFTQIQDRSKLKTLYGTTSARDQSRNTVPLMPLKLSNKKALFFPEKNSNDIIYEDDPIENIEENQSNKENCQKVLCSVPVEQQLLEPFEKIIVNETEYVILNQIGRGGSSVVFHCYDPVDKHERAIKRVNLTGDKICIDGYINEVKMLFKLQKCDRIIRMFSYEIKKSENILLMVLEKGERDLSKILKELSNNTEHLPMYMLIYYWMEMLYAVKQIHENGIIHSDLKPANFLMVSSKLKLIDFGISSSLQNDMTSIVKSVQIGSFNYISPEALINNSKDNETANFKIHFKSDVWSLGCILYQLVYRKTPFQHIGHTHAKLSAIIDPKHEIEYAELNWLPSNILETLKSCLQYHVKLRPSVDDLIRKFENMYY